MVIGKALLEELKQILKEEFNLALTDQELRKFATNLVGYFDLLAKITSRSR